MALLAVAPRHFEFETPSLNCGHENSHILTGTVQEGQESGILILNMMIFPNNSSSFPTHVLLLVLKLGIKILQNRIFFQAHFF